MHYATAGQGEALLLMHQVARSWRAFARLLALLASRYKLVAVDFPGHGESAWFKKPPQVADYTEAIVGVLDALSIEKFSVFGHHAGALFGADIAATFPKRVTAAILSGYPILESEAERRAYMGISTKSMGAALGGGSPRSLPVMTLEQDGSHLIRLWQRASNRLWQGKHAVPYDGLAQEELEFVNDWSMDTVKARFAAPYTFQALWQYDSEKRLKLIRTPTLLVQLSGNFERDICQRVHLVQPLIKASKLYIMESGDIHMMYWRAPEIAKVMTRFLDDPAGFPSAKLPAAPVRK